MILIQTVLAIALLIFSIPASYAQSNAANKGTAKRPLDPTPSKFKMTGIAVARKTKAFTTTGQIEFDGFFINCPDKKTTSPVHLKVGVVVDQKKRPDLVLIEGKYFVETIREDMKDPIQRLTVGKGRRLFDLEEGHSEIDLSLEPGRYSVMTGFRFQNQSPPSWVSDTCNFEILKNE